MARELSLEEAFDQVSKAIHADAVMSMIFDDWFPMAAPPKRKKRKAKPMRKRKGKGGKKCLREIVRV